MILHPGVLALILSSFLAGLMTLYAAGFGAQIIRHWDISSGSELQLSLERRTYLISTVLSYVLGFQLVSLFLFIHTADSICNLFVGAMCAVGSLTANSLGYPALALKSVSFILTGLWLIINHVDSRGYDYPLIRPKYLLLMLIAPLTAAESVVQCAYFLKLQPDIITSCCGALFSQSGRGIATELASIPPAPLKMLFAGGMTAAVLSFGWFLARRSGGYLVSAAAAAAFGISLVSIVSFISLYIYEMPSHHCPFCILQKEYSYIGYPLYVLLFSGAVSGISVGVLQWFCGRESLAGIIPGVQRRLTMVSLCSYLLFTVLVIWKIAAADMVLG